MAVGGTMPYTKLSQQLVAASSEEQYRRIVDAPFDYPVETAFLFLGFISFFLVDETKRCIWLAAVSNTEYYDMSVSGYNFDPAQFQVSLDETDNSIIKAILTCEPVTTLDWKTVKRPDADTNATRLNQANSGIAHSAVYPLTGKVRGALMYNFFQYQENMGPQQQDFMRRYTDLVTAALD